MNPQAVYNLGVELLAAVVAGYANHGITAPATQYLSDHAPIPYCDSIAVAFERIAPGLPAPPAGPEGLPPQQLAAGFVLHADFSIWVWRCEGVTDVQQLVELDPVKETASALERMTDGYVLPMAIMEARSAGLIGADYTTQMVLGAVQTLDPQGDLVGVTLPVSVLIE